jgi:hypothetical protein
VRLAGLVRVHAAHLAAGRLVFWVLQSGTSFYTREPQRNSASGTSFALGTAFGAQIKP